ncbi:hypothetical protein M513_13430 [Trichuris suis]|uniref:Uncharacterized protein n=1 Tax=Trichuris suis TaxID=68888 RepID=A0A085LL44_9BILA|nr:hypothetical protein M513_13430 [Trichuris suis]
MYDTGPVRLTTVAGRHFELVPVIWPKVVWPTGHMADCHLADWSFGRRVVWPTGRLADTSLSLSG